MSSVPAAAPAPVPASAPPVSSTSKSSSKTSGTASTDADLSFLSCLLAGLMNNQSFASAQVTATGGTEPIEVPVQFGGTFNMDPSMLVLPEGVDADTLMSALSSTGASASFSNELLAALTPGLPAAPAGTDTSMADPRLIAAGIDPAQMDQLIAKLTALASQSQSTQTATPATTSVTTQSVAIVSFLPVDAAASPLVVQPSASGVAVQAAVAKASEPVDLAAAVATMPDDDSFDPLEFRLALKPSRPGSVAPYQVAATATDVSASPASGASPGSTADTSAAIKGVMQHSSSAASGPAFSSTFTAGAALDSSGSIATTFDPLLSTTALTTTPAQTGGLTNPVLQNVTAVQSHPATQAVAALINKASQSGPGTQTLAVQLDPPELGKMQLKMKYEKGEPLRVHVVLEKADTMAMFQRDAHALQNALNQAGLQTDGSSLTFDLASQGGFGQAMNDQGGSNQNGPSWSADPAFPDDTIETSLSIYMDPDTGLTHYNMVV